MPLGQSTNIQLLRYFDSHPYDLVNETMKKGENENPIRRPKVGPTNHMESSGYVIGPKFQNGEQISYFAPCYNATKSFTMSVIQYKKFKRSKNSVIKSTFESLTTTAIKKR